jgi:hypothetical protein
MHQPGHRDRQQMPDKEVTKAASEREVAVVHRHSSDISSLLDTFEAEVEVETGWRSEIACL